MDKFRGILFYEIVRGRGDLAGSGVVLLRAHVGDRWIRRFPQVLSSLPTVDYLDDT